MKSHIDKAINLLQIYRMDKNPDYLVMAHREFKKEVKDIKELSITKGTKSNIFERGDED